MASPDGQPSVVSYPTPRDCSSQSCDCSPQSLCTFYCFQWCDFFYTPPPPSDSYHSSSPFFPVLIVIIAVFAAVFLLLAYFIYASKICSRIRRRLRTDHHLQAGEAAHHPHHHHDAWRVTVNGGLDVSVIRSIAVCKYRKGDGFVDGTDCAVCLGEFQEDESLRLLPKCSHAFHIHCIDTWLKSHSNCPLCRAIVAAAGVMPPPPVHHHQEEAPTAAPREQAVISVEDTGGGGAEQDDDDDDDDADAGGAVAPPKETTIRVRDVAVGDGGRDRRTLPIATEREDGPSAATAGAGEGQNST